jgi:uncharacterized protein with FMN-binding domain
MSLATTAALAGVFATLTPSAGAESAAVIVSVGAQQSSTTPETASPGQAAAPVAVPVVVPSTTPIVPGATTTTPPPAAAAQATVVDGAVFRNKWGPVQVEATFGSDGSLIDVVTLQTPDDRSKSIRINDAAVPRLNGAALSAQTASVDSVSGATYTSVGYQQSLQSAIDAARAAGVTTMA